MATLTVITQPKNEPVTLDEAKSALSILHDDEDVRIMSLIKSGREYSEIFCGVTLMTTVIELSMDTFTNTTILLSTTPLQSVDSVKYLSTASPETEVTLVQDTDYFANTTIEGGEVTAISGWPSTSNKPNSVKIRFTAGYADVDRVPEQFKDAIKSYVVYLYDNEKAMLDATRSILWPHRIL